MRTAQSVSLVAAALGGALITALAFGPLNPPAGPVGPTAKPLAEIEPRIAINATNTPGDADSLYKITQPGSYYLTGNVAGVAAKHGIEIAADRVTIDLNGYSVVGVPGSLNGITASIAAAAPHVRNGTIASWGSNGIEFSSPSVTGARLASVSVFSNGGTGIRAGLFADLTDCYARLNGSGGFQVSTAGTLVNCTSSDNTAYGYTTGFAANLKHCLAYSNSTDGFSTSATCNLIGCTSSFNTGDGIVVGNGSTVSQCTVLGNDGDGIQCTFGSFILNNNCDQQALACIHVLNSSNRIEGNNCTNSTRGIDVDGANNIILRNTCATNGTSWTIVANNVFGPILDRTAPASAAVNGASAPDSSGSTHPNANFTY